MTVKLDAETLTERLHQSRVPEHMHDGLILWLTEGIPPGSFMTAILTNDLREACNRADDTNRYRLYDFVFFLYNYAPVGSWGSWENVQDWIKGHQARREALR